jgi:subtilase family serine protease
LKRYFLIFAVFVLLLIGMVQCSPKVKADGPDALPDKLIVAGTPFPRTAAGQITVTQQPLVASIYTHILTLPAQPHQICPDYVRAEYQLVFIAHTKTALQAKVLIGGCNTVILSTGKNRVRVIDATLLKLMKKTGAAVLTTSPEAFGGGYRPLDLQSAYGLPSSTNGSGQTVAIVDAYNDPYAESDLAIYRTTFNLPACDTPDGCFRKVNQSGGATFPKPDTGWAGEIALDLDMVSAVCPNCHILLVEANSSSFADLGASVDTAVRLGATIVSNSYGSSEDSSTRSYAHYYAHPGVIIVASSGDSGYGVESPASYNTVTAVGGTTLTRATNARGWQETAWAGSGSGCSAIVSKPIWQWDSGCSKRTVVDVAAVADPETGVAVYNTYGGNGWAMYGGTSVAAPIIAGVYGLAGNAVSTTNEHLYKNYQDLNGVVSGSNGSCNPKYLCTAGPGYNGPTGLGTPNGVGAF